MAILGGLNSVSGAVVGAFVLSAINEVLRRLEGGFNLGITHVPSVPEMSQLVLGVGLIALLRWRPEGIFRKLRALARTDDETASRQPP